jgi:hypothetical protein
MSNYFPVQNQDTLNFQSFDYGNAPEPAFNSSYQTVNFDGSVSWTSVKRAFSAANYEDDLPLLQGIKCSL